MVVRQNPGLRAVDSPLPESSRPPKASWHGAAWKFRADPFLVPFAAAFALVFLQLWPMSSLAARGDAYSIWQTITTFDQPKITSSYVLYKGFLAVHPYVWMHRWSSTLGIDAFLPIKIYHALLFAFVGAVGVPYVVARTLSVRPSMLKNLLFVFVLLWSTWYTGIYSALMIDLPSWTFFVGGTFAALLAVESQGGKRIAALLVSGVLTGLSLCASGQYSIAALLVAAFVLLNVCSEALRHPDLRSRSMLAAGTVLFLVAAAAPKIYDAHFHASVVQPMRDRGEWLPTGTRWLTNGMTRLMPMYKYGYPDTSNRGLAVMKQVEGRAFEKRYDVYRRGGDEYSIDQYIAIVKSHWPDFLVMWSTKAFLSLSFDGGKARVSALWVSYTALFVCLLLMVRRCRQLRDLLTPRALFPLAAASTILAPVFLFIDMRYGVALHAFILGFAILQEDLWVALKQNARQLFVRRESGNRTFASLAIPHPWIAYVLFVLFCFTLYGALLEIPGSDPAKVLFKW